MITKLKICSSIYNIEYINNLVDEHNGRLHGYIEPYNLKIQINKKYPIIKQNQSILHEAIHGINSEYGFDFKEEIVDRLSNAVFAFLIDNKKYIGEIIG